MKKRDSILKDKSVIWAVGLLAAMIILLGYNQFTGAASPATGMMGVYSGTTTSNNATNGNLCSYCAVDGSCVKSYSSSPCTNACADDPSKCKKNPSTKCSYGQHWDCMRVAFGTTARGCGCVAGTSADNDSCNDSNCPKFQESQDHQVCENEKCVKKSGPGQSTCSSDASCKSGSGGSSGGSGGREKTCNYNYCSGSGSSGGKDTTWHCVPSTYKTTGNCDPNKSRCSSDAGCQKSGGKGETQSTETTGDNSGQDNSSSNGFWSNLWRIVMSWFGR